MTIAGTLRAASRTRGQICLCGSRLFVEAAIFERVPGPVRRRRARAPGRRPVGPVHRPGCAVISRRTSTRCRATSRSPARKAARSAAVADRRPPFTTAAATASSSSPRSSPACDADCRVNQEEIFGPVVSVTPFRDEDEAVALANATATAWRRPSGRRDLQRAHRIAAATRQRHRVGQLLAAARPAGAVRRHEGRAAWAARAARRRSTSSPRRRTSA